MDVPSSAAGSVASISASGVNATMTVDSWGGGYCANIALANGSTSAVTSWTLVVAMNGTTLGNMWGGTSSVSGGSMTIRPVDYTTNIAAGQTVTLGFCGTGTGSPALSTLEVVGGGGGPTNQTLTVTKSGAGAGTVSSSPAGISCGSTCTGSFATGAVVTLSAAPASGSTFGGWSGACSGTAATCTVTMSGAQSVVASFGTTPTAYTLSVVKTGTGSGTVTAPGISCGATCSAVASLGATVTLTATAASGSTFGGFTSTCPISGSSVSITGSCTVTATFTANVDPGTAVSVNAGGAAAGTFVADAYFSGGSTYSTTNAIDTTQLAGTAPPQSVFQSERYGEFTYTIPNRQPGSAQTVTLYFSESYWTAAGQRTFDVAINGAPVLTAFDIFAAAGAVNRAVARTFNTTANSSGQVVIQFTRGGGPDNAKVCGITVAGGSVSTFPLTVTRSNVGTGTVTSNPAGISCGSTCTASFASGALVTLTATPASGSTFGGWSGACSGTSTCVVSMTAAQSVTAAFLLQVTSYALTVTKSGTGSGTVTSNPSGINCGSTCTASYASGTTVTLSAAAASGSTFGGFGGACTGTGTCTVSMTAARTVTATFTGTPPPPPGNLVGWATVGGTVTGGGNAAPVTVTTLSALNSAAGGTTPAVIVVSGTITGNVAIGSNKTIQGANASATIKGSIRMKASANVILRNLNVVGYNCTDSTSSCEGGADAIGVDTGAHHLWFDHLAVSDGSDGNLDLTHAVDYVTISWTKFFYTGRSGGHQFSNLIGHSDSNAAEDTGHLRITFHHCWWANGVGERMPRVRFGQVHVFNSLYTATGNNYCIAPAMGASVLVENNAFIGVSDPLDLSYGDGSATVRGNLFTNVSGNTSGRGTAFTPPYAYTLEAASSVEASVRAGAGPK